MSFFFPCMLFCQVGINTTAPMATLDVVGNPGNSSEIDGIIIPRISGDQLVSKDPLYGQNQVGVIVYVTSLPTSLSQKTNNVDDIGYYYFDGTIWMKLSYKSLHSVGDVKSCFNSLDHNGWIKLDGRPISTLSLSQQSNALLLGFVNNLPDASDKILAQGSGGLGSLSSATLINQNQLPNVVLSGSTSSDGLHNHSVDPSSISTSSDGSHIHTSNAVGTSGNFGLIRRSVFYQNVTASPSSVDTSGSGNEPDIVSTVGALVLDSGGVHTHLVDIPSTPSSSEGNHSHSITTTSINGNTIQQPLGVSNLPRLNVNVFVYLGR